MSARRADIARWLALAAVMFGVIARAVVNHEPTPGFGFDPMVQVPPPVGMGPTAAMLLDSLTLLGAASVLWLEGRSTRGVRTWMAGLGLIGSVPVALHGLVLNGLNIESLRIGGSWMAAVFAAIALWHAGRDPIVRRAVVGLLLAAAGLLIVKGLTQVFIEHPATLANFRANREAVLAAQGMLEGSPQAMAFARRLAQPDPTGWLGLTNVFLSIIVATGLMAGACALGAWKSARGAEDRSGLVARIGLIGLIGGCALLVLAGPMLGGSLAKGPAGALLLGGGLVTVGVWNRTRTVPGWTLGLVAVALPLCAVVARGMAGDSLGELSLRFRWFYLVGAAGIFADAPLLGVGPDGFQAAYLLHKPELSPEQVSSPHSVLADWLACLGLAGLAWAGLLIAWGVSLGERLRLGGPESATTVPVRTVMIWLGGTLAAVIVWNLIFQEWPIAAEVPGGFVLMISAVSKHVLTGLVAAGAGLAVVRFASEPVVRTAAVGAALVLLAHAQIEMVLTTTGSAAWGMCLIAVAAAPSGQPGARRSNVGLVLTLLASCTGLGLGGLALGPVREWETRQVAASESLAIVTRVEQRLREAIDDPEPDPATIDRRKRALAFRAGSDVDRPISELVSRARLRAADGAAELLSEAADRGGEPLRTLVDLSGVYLSAAQHAQRIGQDAGGLEQSAIDAARRAIDRWPDRTRGYNALGMAARQRWQRTGDEADAELAREALEQGLALDPGGMAFVWALFELADARGDRSAAAMWASRALAVDETLRLDPMVRLPSDRADRARRAANGER